ncbi:MAG: hypothetical protein CSB47_03355 [Proteobacteria bacterium]|nr:MAG: hypothetical protein CSB47_03355 [Pseudomonadota bacterium]
MQRRDFLRLTASLAVTSISSKALAGAGKFRLFSASDNDQGLHRLTLWESASTQAKHFAIPFRAHDILPFPDKQHVMAFGRRPEMHCVVVNTQNAKSTLVDAKAGRHFYGHGCFSQDGSTLFTTENFYDKGTGVIGIRDSQSMTVLGEYQTHGVGPHDIHLMPDGKTLVVANGGIATHPDYGRRKLNIDTMQPSLVYIDLSNGQKLDEFRLKEHKLSIRHLSVNERGDVGVATQYQGNSHKQPPPCLVAYQRHGQPLKEISIPTTLSHAVRGYMADIAHDPHNEVLIATAPRGNRITLWDTRQFQFIQHIDLPQPSGIQYLADEKYFVISSATGGIYRVDLNVTHPEVQLLYSDRHTAWDNHLVIT